MKTLEMKEASAPLSEYAREVKKEPLILTIGGKPVAALVPLENADLETARGISGTEIPRRLRLAK